ncbi:fused response regulator of ato opeon, in two-component system with AtoS: response regulator; sigma54 interaction protein [Candidatus Methylobacter favarea]|uniref:Fused response regulator of ato opeon, in two-component system with AtoS: response regulator sigma54 interaction protein n=1 Tax=Candidatus Methylobacter favarea TaxID=2707345 RepID=A0A8S0XHF5_9GAMM|nr:sigma-54 dependent transcriptional regulator [Candidatus Methylobacter favarea]CAA9891811.1 fused response regulator of ato opeon, in two-component system with AtoS: response regulator; sigma54 interaction protein [Candidatus Methylobacter favarea]
MKQYDVLIVEDDPALCEALCETLELEGYRVMSAGTGAEALTRLALSQFKLVVSDVQMPVMDGFQLLKTMHASYSETPVVLMTAYGTIPKAVEAMQAGACDYLIKPFEAKDLVRKVAAYVMAGPKQANSAANKRIVHDDSMKKLYALISKVAKTDASVLLQGESGTGKEVIARYIHQNSTYFRGPFIAVNCAAIPENMLEAMLFGYEKGAFTGSVQAMPGKFEQAQEGTLLLDEIAEMDLALQAKLLRVLQEKEVERLGSHKKIRLTVRILAATNQNLKDQLELGRFREDLYYRLSVFPIHIPPLRSRPGDILPLASGFIQRHSGPGKTLPAFDKEAVKKMLAYYWPGNVRELDNVIQRALILRTGDSITAEDLVFEEGGSMGAVISSQSSDAGTNCQGAASSNEETQAAGLGESVRCAEENMILQTLQMENGNRKTTAEKLGISPRTLRYKMARIKEAGITLPC